MEKEEGSRECGGRGWYGGRYRREERGERREKVENGKRMRGK